jgi:hypothetical protein
MKWTARALLIGAVGVLPGSLALGLGCGNDSEDEADSREEERAAARQYYVTQVHPGITSCVDCHSGKVGTPFMAPAAEASYESLERAVGMIAAPKTSPLVQHEHSDSTVTFTPEQRSLLTRWLSLEATARGLEGAVEKPKTVTEAYEQFAKCMNFDVWSYYRMGDLAFTQTDSEGPCLGCHSTGQGSAWLSAGSRETFEKTRTFPFIQKLVVGRLDERGSFESLAPSYRFIEKSAERCPPDSTACHPTYGLPPNVTTSVKGFVETTLQNLATDTCASGIVVAPSDGGVRDAGDGG